MNFTEKSQKLEALIAEMQLSHRELRYWCFLNEISPLQAEDVIETPLPVVYYLGRCSNRRSPEYKSPKFETLSGIAVARVSQICGVAVPTGTLGNELRFSCVNEPLAAFQTKTWHKNGRFDRFAPNLSALRQLLAHKNAFNRTMACLREFGVCAEDLLDAPYFGNSADTQISQGDNGRFLLAGALDFASGETQMLNQINSQAYRRLCL